MKKFLFCAFAALAFAFTACDNNNPSDPGEYDAKDYVGTQWITDSTLVGAEVLPAPHAYIKVISETMVEINGYEREYKIEGAVMTLDPNDQYAIVLNIIRADKDHAVLAWKDFQEEGVDGYVHMTRVPYPEGADLDVTKANVAGTWREAFFIQTSSYRYVDPITEEATMRHDVLIHGMPGKELYELKSDGSAVNTNSFDRIYEAAPRTGWWGVSGNKIVITSGTPEYPAQRPEDVPEDQWWTVTKLTKNVMQINHAETFTDSSYETMRYFYRVD